MSASGVWGADDDSRDREVVPEEAVQVEFVDVVDGDTFDALFDGQIEVPDADTEWRPAAARPREWSSIGTMAITREAAAD